VPGVNRGIKKPNYKKIDFEEEKIRICFAYINLRIPMGFLKKKLARSVQPFGQLYSLHMIYINIYISEKLYYLENLHCDCQFPNGLVIHV